MGFGGEAHKYSMGVGSTAETGSADTAGVEDGSETRANSTPVFAGGHRGRAGRIRRITVTFPLIRGLSSHNSLIRTFLTEKAGT